MHSTLRARPLREKWPVLTFPMLYALARMFTWPKRTTSEGDIALQKEGPTVAQRRTAEGEEGRMDAVDERGRGAEVVV